MKTKMVDGTTYCVFSEKGENNPPDFVIQNDTNLTFLFGQTPLEERLFAFQVYYYSILL